MSELLQTRLPAKHAKALKRLLKERNQSGAEWLRQLVIRELDGEMGLAGRVERLEQRVGEMFELVTRPPS